jgi:ATP-dependent Clp protease ATP-binding subunit ClpC
MAETKTNSHFQTIICPNCAGSGQGEKRKVCHVCQGVGEVAFLEGQFLYWGKRINFLTILERKIEVLVKNILEFGLFAFGLLGLAVLVWQVWQVEFREFLNWEFWFHQPKLMLIFWLSILSDMYLFYRKEREFAGQNKVRKKKFQENLPQVVIEPKIWPDFSQIKKIDQIDVSQTLAKEAQIALENAWQLAQRIKTPEVLPIHLFGILLTFDKIKMVFVRLGINLMDLDTKVRNLIITLSPSQSSQPQFSSELKQIIFLAYELAYNSSSNQLDLIEILLALSQRDENTKLILDDLDINQDKIKNVACWSKIQENLRQRWLRFRHRASWKPKGTMDRAMTAVATPFLDYFSQDLTILAKAGYLDLCVGREKEIEEIFRTVEASRQSVILVGNPGVGRTTIIEGIAQLMTSEDVPSLIQDKRLISLSVAKLISGASPSEAQGRLQAVIEEIKRAGNVVLFVSDLHEMADITPGGEESLDLLGVLLQALAKNYFFCFATTTPSDYARYLEVSSGLSEVFQKINIGEPDPNQTIQILEAKSARIEAQNQVYFSYDAIEKTVKMTIRYIHDRFLPDKAIRVLEQVAIYVQKKKGAHSVVSAEDVAELISQKTNIPLTRVTEEESAKLLNLEARIHERIIDQDEAVKIVAAALRRARAELRDIKRPIVNLLFLGPTGVGKTEVSKTVAEVYFGSESNMIRLDMSEYQEQTSVYRLIGAPVGGSREPGYFTEAVRNNPFSLVLLDEVEKAHPDILNLFLQVMDDGRLTDNTGRTIDFTNIILIATSNAGTGFIGEKMKEGWTIEKIKQGLIEMEIKQYFRPEFLNRFDGIVVFKPLTIIEVREIAKLFLKKVAGRLADKGINLEVTEEAVAELAQAGFDPQFGARPLRRVIQERVDDSLAHYLLTQKISRRDTVVFKAGGVIEIKKAKKI